MGRKRKSDSRGFPDTLCSPVENWSMVGSWRRWPSWEKVKSKKLIIRLPDEK